MNISVPLLLSLVDVVILRRNAPGTRALNPPGAASSGMDDIFREPVVYDTQSGAQTEGREDAMQYQPPIRVQCQVETTMYNLLNTVASGNIPDSQVIFVTHRKQLRELGLIDPVTGNALIRTGDLVTSLERTNQGVTVLTFPGKGLYITEVRPASWGFGIDGHDLHLIIAEPRDQGSR